MANPLQKHFRQPSIHMSLPSEGRWWKPGSLELSATRQVPVYPMTAKDEILLRTPDALMNGSSIIELFQNCCPAIKNGWAVPNIDVDALLIAIRVASYGPMLDINNKCPHCGADNLHQFDLTTRLEAIKCPDFNEIVRHDGLEYKFQPLTYFGITREKTINFRESKLLEALEAEGVDTAEKEKLIREAVKNLSDANILSLAYQTESIKTDEGKVDDFSYIHEFYTNSSAETIRYLNTKLKEIYDKVRVPDNKAACVECSKEYTIPFEFDYSSFFGRGF